MPERHYIAATLLPLAALTALAAMVAWGLTGQAPVFELSFTYIVMCGVYLYAVKSFDAETDSKVLRVLFLGAIFSRLILIFAPINLTSDIYRYLWEGRAVRAGINPYLYSPAMFAGAPQLPGYFPLIQHSELPAIYPPAAQFLFAAFAWSELCWKAILCLCEAGSLVLLGRTLKKLGIPGGRIVRYSFLPLPLVEISCSGHLEGFGVLIVALLLAESVELNKVKFSLIGMMAALAAGLKYIGIVPFIFLLRKSSTSRSDVWRFSLFFSITISLLFIPFLDSDLTVFKSLQVYLDSWRFNDSLFAILGSIFGVDWNHSESLRMVKLICCGAWIAAVFVLFKRCSSWVSISLYATALLLLFGPVFHPWYGLWFAPFLIFANSPALTYLALALPLSYFSVLAADKDPSLVIRIFEFLPTLLLLLTELSKKKLAHQNDLD